MKLYPCFKVVRVVVEADSDEEPTYVKKSVGTYDGPYCLTYQKSHFTIPPKPSLIMAFATREFAERFIEMYLRVNDFELWSAYSRSIPKSLFRACSPSHPSDFRSFWTGIDAASYPLPSGTIGCRSLRLNKLIF